ncbi:MAG TPA: class I fructose-bisphosphate aldolase [Burkholderiales bacterium]|nr:class I fructose-bisphosphate aldolase [Burkholderiales bacterium]
MRAHELERTAQALVGKPRGILAADESNGTCDKRLKKVGVEGNIESRRAYRDLLFTTPDLGEFVSGVILYDETIRQQSLAGRSFVEVLQKQGIMPGIKVDTGAKDLAGFPGEKVTEGLDGLRERLQEYVTLGARFTKWRAVITIGEGTPTRGCIEANAHALARYAALAQEAGLVPIVEPEVLMDGNHTIERSYEVTEETLKTVFGELYRQRVTLEHMLLKASMVISGAECRTQAGVEAVAAQTLRCLKSVVPAALPGVVFLSGGQSDERATAHLNAMNQMADKSVPWPLSFSYARAIQQPALDLWRGQKENISRAQAALAHRARMNSLASLGRYNPDIEKQVA